MKPKVLFFARSFLAKYCAEIKSDIFESLYIVLTHEEKIFLESKGYKVLGCFEDDYAELKVMPVHENYLKTSFVSDRFLNRFKHSKRLEILGKEITFWRNILESLKPNFLVNETVAIEIAEVMAIEAERLNIPFLSSLLGFLPNTFYWKPNPFHGTLNDLSHIKPSIDDIKKAQEYINNVIEKNQRPFYIAESLKYERYSIKTFIGSIYHDTLSYFHEKKIHYKIKPFHYEDNTIFYFQLAKQFLNSIFYSHNFYSKFSDLADKKIIFYPLHIEPEATLNYFSEEYCDQAATIENIAKIIKTNQYLIIKEHPQQAGALLQRNFRNIKKRYSNVIFLPSEISSFEILKKCDAIVTLTSTAAWEGVILGKPVFVLGKIFFDQCYGVTKINDFKQLKEEIRSINYHCPEKEKTLHFIASMITIFHNASPTPYAVEDIIQNVEGYTRALEIEIQK